MSAVKKSSQINKKPTVYTKYPLQLHDIRLQNTHDMKYAKYATK